VRASVLVALAACAAPHATPADPPADPSAAPPSSQVRAYTIWLGGARVGTAIESETWSALGVKLARTETMRFLRGETEVELDTSIDIDADLALVAHRVRWSERTADGVRRAEVIRDGRAWRATDPAIVLAPDAVPAELVPMIVRRDGRFAGRVFLPARNFVGGRGRIDPVAPDRLIARLAFDVAPDADPGPLAEATIDLDRDRMPARVVDGDGVIAIRTTITRARVPFQAVDLVAATAVPISGVPRTPRRLVLEGDLAVPPVPGQDARPSPAGVSVELGAALPGRLAIGARGPDRAGDIRALVAGVRRRITPDLGATPASAHDADAATAGDCTTFALAYAALATRRGIPTRVVTGLRVDGDRLVRHRWAVSWTGRAWIAVDAAFGAAPAGGDLVGLAVTDADDAGLVAGEAALAQVRGAAWN
jgi:transglutaminase-like putative cysteine protease